VVVDARSGVVAAGGEITVGAAVVSHEWLTLTIAPPDGQAPVTPDAADAGPPDAVLPPGAVRAEPGVRVQSLAEALHSVGASADVIGAVLRSLRDVGALRAEVQVR
jgi:flagellar basal body P-ring protein FlgI